MYRDPFEAGKYVVAFNCAVTLGMMGLWLQQAHSEEPLQDAQDALNTPEIEDSEIEGIEKDAGALRKVLAAKKDGNVEEIVQLAESYMSSDQYENAQAAVDVILKHGRPEHGMRQRIELFLVDADPHSHCRSGTTPEWREEMAERLWAVYYAINGIKPVIKDTLDHDI